MGGAYHAPRVGGGTGGASSLGGNPPLQRTFTVNFGNIDNLLNLIGGALNTPSTVASVEVQSKTPTTYNYTIGIQQDIVYQTVMKSRTWLTSGTSANAETSTRSLTTRFIDLNPLGSTVPSM